MNKMNETIVGKSDEDENGNIENFRRKFGCLFKPLSVLFET